MDAITAKELIAMFDAVARRIEEEKDRLSALDGVIGDADHGVTMSIGFSAVTAALARLEPGAEPAAVFNTAARTFLNAVGASSGPLYATALMRAGAAAKGLAALDRQSFAAAFLAMAQGIRERGKAEPGEKTMVDAWAPAAEAAKAALERGEPLAAILAAAAAAAHRGAEATKSMQAAKGRAARLGERSLGHMDPGAASTALIVQAMADTLGR